MNAMVIGLGSMGRRRIRLIMEGFNAVEIIGVDTSEERRIQSENEYGINTEPSVKSAIENRHIDVAFICSSPLSHAQLIRQCLGENMHVFSEINLHTLGYEDNIALANRRNRVLFLSSTFLYRKEIQYISESISRTNGLLSYQYHVGQYLPDWHPWEDYKDFFVGKKETNGCREFMAIDFPWILALFGKVNGYYVTKRKMSRLDLPYDDMYQITLEHEKAIGQIMVDVVTRRAVRNLEISGEDLYLSWDGSPRGLYRYDVQKNKEESVVLYEKVNKREDYNSTIIEDAYFEEIQCFFDVIAGKDKPRYTFDDDLYTIDLINKIEEGDNDLV